MRSMACAARGLILPALATLLLAFPALGDDSSGSRATLKGVTAVKVRVAQMTLDTEQWGLRSEDLQAEVERRLKGTGIVVTPSALVLLFIDIDTVKASDVSRYACSVRVEVLQLVRLARDPMIESLTPTWSLGRIEEVSASKLPIIRGIVGDLVDQFISAYREQNPRQ